MFLGTRRDIGIRAVTWLGFVILIAIQAATVGAATQRTPRAEATARDNSVFLPAPRELTRPLLRAERAVEEGNYAEAVRQLGAVLEDTETEDYFIPSRDGSGTSTTIKAEAQRILGTLPPRGRDFYQLRYGIQAKHLLDDAVDKQDIQLISKVTQLYFHTDAGYEAMILLGRDHMNHARPLAAARCFQRIVQTSAARQKYEPEISLLLATSWLYGGLESEAQRVLIELKRRYPAAQVHVNGRQHPLFADDSESLVWLATLVGQGLLAPIDAPKSWNLHRGNLQRTAQSPSGLPLFDHRWNLPTVNHPDDEQQVQELRDQYADQGISVIPSVHPIALQGFVVIRTPAKLIGVDFKTGKRKWVFPWDKDDVLFKDQQQSRSTRIRNTAVQKIQLRQRLWEDAAFGQLSSDGQRVFVIDRLGFAGPSQINRVGITVGGNAFPSGPKDYNRLVALKLVDDAGRRVEGKLAWIVGGEDGTDEPQLARTFFLGAPLALHGQLYVLAEVRKEIRLVVLDAATGKLLWSQQLATVEQRGEIRLDAKRRLAGASPSFADGILICPTSAGAVIAIDVSTRALLWGFEYPTADARSILSFRSSYGSEQYLPGRQWVDATVTIARGKVLLTPVESDHLYCLDLTSGVPVWDQPRDRGESMYVASATDDAVVLVGRRHVTALRLEDGSTVWKTPLEQHGMPSGRGYASNQHYFLPTTTAKLLQLDLSNGNITQIIETDQALGNLVCYQGNVISQGVDHLAAYYLDSAAIKIAASALRDNPKDPQGLLLQGRILQQQGQWSDAMRCMSESYQLAPRAETKQLLMTTLLRSLQHDFQRSQPSVQQFESMLLESSHRKTYLRFKVEGLTKMGRIQDAFTSLIQLADSPFDSLEPDLFEIHGDDGSKTSLRQDRWIQSKLAGLFEIANDTQRQAIQQALDQRLQGVLKSAQADRLSRYWQRFGDTHQGETAQLGLARLLLDQQAYLHAELLFSPLTRSQTEEIARTANAGLCLLLERTGQQEQARRWYQRLADTYGDDVCWQQSTGNDLKSAFEARIAADSSQTDLKWNYGLSNTQIGKKDHDSYVRHRGRLYPVTRLQTQGAVQVDQIGVVYEPFQENAIYIRRANGQTLARIGIKKNAFYSNNANFGAYRLYNHLLVLMVGYDLIGIDLLKANEDPDSAVIWHQSLLPEDIDSSASRPGGRQSILSRSISNPWGMNLKKVSDRNNLRIGTFGSISLNGIAFVKRHELCCIDPLSGELLWKRNGLEPGSDCFGDGQTVYVVNPAGTQAKAFDMLDGSFQGNRSLTEFDRCLRRHGSQYVTWRRDAKHQVLFSYDAGLEATVWELSFPSGTKANFVDDHRIATLQPNGLFEIYSLLDGQRMLACQVEPDRDLSSILVLKQLDRYLLVTNRYLLNRSDVSAHRNNQLRYQPAPDRYSAVLIDGQLHAIDAASGRLLWHTPVAIDQFSLPLNQPAGLPVLTLIRHARPARRTSERLRIEALCIDVRDGRILMPPVSILGRLYHYHVHGSVEDQQAHIELQGSRFSISFTDQPMPPAPPAQTGRAVKAAAHQAKGP